MDNGSDDLEQLLIPESEELNFTDDIDHKALREVGISEEDFLSLASKKGVQAAIDFVENLRKTSVNSSENEHENENTKDINLSTESFISLVTGKKIELAGMNLLDKISTIYYHTGVSISVDDTVLLGERTRGLYSFGNYLDNLSSEQVSKYFKKYGANWKAKMFESYQKAWNEVIQLNIDNEKDKAVNRLRNDLVNERKLNSSLIQKQDVNNSLLRMQVAKDALVREKESLQKISSELYDFVDSKNSGVHDYIDSKVEEYPPRRH